MAYPLIILGAGASHDYSDLCPLPPPITRQLVSRDHLDRDLLEKYPPASDLLSEIESAVNTHNQSFEQALHNIKERSGHIYKIQAQLVALEFYLQELFEKISTDAFQKINSYKTLQQHITAYSADKACVVSFNYDSLFEDSVVGKTWKNMNDYINGDLKVIKLHGSHNWSYITHKDAVNFRDDYRNGYDFLIKNPNFLSSLRSKGEISPYHKKELEGRGYFTFPALATPLLSKKDSITCPKQHLDVLKQELDKVDRILIIGWQAADNFLLDLIKEHVGSDVSFVAVTKTNESAVEIEKKFFLTTGLSGQGVSGGFRNFVGSHKYHNFLSSSGM